MARLLLAAAIFFGVGTAQTARAQPEPAKEYDVKAAFLFRFAQFVQWPDIQGRKSICVGVLEPDPFGAALDEVVDGESIQGRKVVVRRSAEVEGLRGCEIVFIGRTARNRTAEHLASIEEGPVLTVGEAEGFAHMGGVINFFVEGQKLRFEINPAEARRRGLKLSSQLLTLGRIVNIDPPGEE